MTSKKIDHTKDSLYQSNLSTPSKFPRYSKENSDYFGSANKIGGDDMIYGEICYPNLSKDTKNLEYNNKENYITKTKTKTKESLFQEKNTLENIKISNEKKDIKNFIGKKINNIESKKTNKKKKRKISKDSEQSSEKLNEENKDNSFKAAIKAPFIFLIILINEIGNIKLKSVNLKRIIGGVRKNKIIFKLKLYQMLCNDKKRKNKEILDNAHPNDGLLYNYFLTRNYRFLYYHYYDCNKLFHINEKYITVDSFPTFDTVLEERIKRYYNNLEEDQKEKKIEEFIKASLLVYKNFEGCVEREPKKEKIFFAIRAPKLDDLNKKYNNIINVNKQLEKDNICKLKINKNPIKLNENKLSNIKLDENSEDNHFSLIKNTNIDLLKNDLGITMNEQTFCINLKEENMVQEDNIFPENYIQITPENFSHSNKHKKSNVNSFSDFDNENLPNQKIVNYKKLFHELY